MDWVRLIALILTVIGIVFIKMRGGKWTFQVQLTAVAMIVVGTIAMLIEYYVDDLNHMPVLYIGGALAMAGIAINLIAAFARWYREEGRNKNKWR